MRDDPEDPERDIASRLEEMKSRESIQLLLNNYSLYLLCLQDFPHVVGPKIFVYFLGVIDCR